MKIAILLLAMSFSAVAQQLPNPLKAEKTTPAWYDHAIIYEIYPRSFQDTNGDGVGDLKGVTQRLDYLQKLGIDAIWLTHFFPSSNLAFGYGISNYTDVAPEYGTMADWDNLVAEAKKRNIRVLVDFVLNHTSSQHSWFLDSASGRDSAKRNWYVWHDGKSGNQPPTNWLSIFGGSTWTLDPDPRSHTPSSRPCSLLRMATAPYNRIEGIMKIAVETKVAAPIEVVWNAWTTPADIIKWNAASDDWHTTAATVDLRAGGTFSSRMEAKDGSMGFDFAGTYTRVIEHELIESSIGDRILLVEFLPGQAEVTVRETFDAEATHSEEQQRQGWQAILDRFAQHVEAKQSGQSV